MSDFFVRLAERATGQGLTVHPLFSSRYSSEPESQGISDARTESRMGAAQMPTESSNSIAPGRTQPGGGSPVAELRDDNQPRNDQPKPTERTHFPSPPLSDSPSIELEELPQVVSTNNRQPSFRQDSTREMSSTKASNLRTERPAVLPVPIAFDPTRVVAMGDLDHRDFHAGRPIHRDPVLADPEQLAFHQDKPLLSPTLTRSNSVEQTQSATATVGDLLTQHAIEESVRVGSLEQWPTESTSQFQLATVPARMDTSRSDVGPPVVRVTIGRIEVRAIMPSVTSERPKPTRAQPVISLDEYLKQGKGAAR